MTRPKRDRYMAIGPILRKLMATKALTQEDIMMSLRLLNNKSTWEELLENVDNLYRDFRDDRWSDEEL